MAAKDSMENEHFEPTQHETNENVAESLPERLNFYENEELKQLRPHLVEAMISGDAEAVLELATQYQAVAEQIVNKQQGVDFSRAQIGLMVAMSFIRRDAGRESAYLEDISDALEYATAMGHLDVVPLLQQAHNEARQAMSSSDGDARRAFTRKIFLLMQKIF